MVKQLVVILTLLLGVVGVSFSQTITVDVPQVVVAGQQFEISYSIDSKNIRGIKVIEDDKEISLPNKRNPQKFSSSGFKIDSRRGQSATVNTTLTFKGIPKITNGEIKIPILQAMVDGVQVSSPGGYIQVAPSSALKNRKDFIAALELSSNAVFEGETVTAELKFYFSKDLDRIESEKFPSLKGLTTTKLEQNGYEQSQALYNGKVYNSALIGRYEIIADSAGNYTFPAINAAAVIKVQYTKNGYRRAYKDEKFPISTKATSLKVLALNGNKSKNYLGVFSELTLQSKTSASVLDVNQALELSLELNGTGNFSSLNSPQLTEMSQLFQVYPPEIKEHIQTTPAGVKGTKTFKYTLVPKFTGKRTIPELKLQFFNSKSESFELLLVPQFELSVKAPKTETLDSIATQKVTVFTPISVMNTYDSGKPIFTQIQWYIGGLLGIFGIFGVLLLAAKVKERKELEKSIIPKLSPDVEALQKLDRLKLSTENSNVSSSLYDVLENYFISKFSMPRGEFNKTSVSPYLSSETTAKLQAALFKIEQDEFAQKTAKSMTSDERMNRIEEIEKLILKIESQV